jgi:CHAT domain-containing protein
VLSDCQTAVTEYKQLPEEAIGLPAGFLQAGVPGVIGSLWTVEDLSTALLMQRFYLNHLRGDPDDPARARAPLAPDEALRQAQLWLRDRLTVRQVREYLARVEKDKQISPAQASAYRREYEGRPEDELPFASPRYWAAFTAYGV